MLSKLQYDILTICERNIESKSTDQDFSSKLAFCVCGYISAKLSFLLIVLSIGLQPIHSDISPYLAKIPTPYRVETALKALTISLSGLV